MDKIEILIHLLETGLRESPPPLAECSAYDHLVVQTLTRRHGSVPTEERRECIEKAAKQPWLKKWLDGNDRNEITAKLSSIALAQRAARLN